MARIPKGSQFYPHTPHSSTNEINHTCLCLPSQSWYSFTDHHHHHLSMQTCNLAKRTQFHVICPQVMSTTTENNDIQFTKMTFEHWPGQWFLPLNTCSGSISLYKTGEELNQFTDYKIHCETNGTKMTQSSFTISMTTVIECRRHLWQWRGNGQHTQHKLVPCLSNQLNCIFMRCTCHIHAIYLQPQAMLVLSESKELSSEYFVIVHPPKIQQNTKN